MTRKSKPYDIRRDSEGNMTHIALPLKNCLPIIASRKGKFHDDRQYSYSGWFDWADKMAKTHKNIRCPGCGLFALWLPGKKKEPTK